MLLILLSSIVIGAILYVQYYKKWRVQCGQLGKLTGPRNYPLVGNAWIVLSYSRAERIKYINSLLEKYGGLFLIWLGSRPVVICANAEDAEIILSSRVNIEKSTIYGTLVPWLGTGLLNSGGCKWHQRRKLLTPAFHFAILETFLTDIVEHSKTFVEGLKRMENEKGEWNIAPFVNRFTLDVICETAMGVEMNIQTRESSEYLQNVSIMSTVVLEKILKPWWSNKFLYPYSNLYKKEKETLRVLHGTSMDVIRKNKQKRQENCGSVNHLDSNGEKKKKAFLDLLIDLSEDPHIHLTDEDIREEVDTFMFEGHDTTSSGIASTIHFLSTHSQIQARVAEELFSVFGDSDRDPTLQDISKLKYLECVVKESHRLLPPVPAVGRTLSEAVVLGGEHLIPADTLVEINIYGIQRQEKYFPNPKVYDPDNFAPENVHNRPPFAFVPFSAGPRNCIGQKFAMLEEKVVLSSLLRNYELKSSQKTEDLGSFFELVLRHENGVHVTVSPRVWT